MKTNTILGSILIIVLTVFLVFRELREPIPKLSEPSKGQHTPATAESEGNQEPLQEPEDLPLPLSEPLTGDHVLENPDTAPSRPSLPHSKTTAHFLVYHENPLISPGFLSNLEAIHARLMLDLVLFAPWAKSERMTIFLYNTPQSYTTKANRPGWSSGTADIVNRLVHVYESDKVNGVLAHELSHVLLGDFFVKEGVFPPKWIFEGVAVFMESEFSQDNQGLSRGVSSYFKSGAGMSLKDLTTFDPETAVAGKEAIETWYMQSYSLVKYLLKSKGNYLFFKFCSEIRDKKPLEEALKSAYGWGFSNLEQLERSWRENL